MDPTIVKRESFARHWFAQQFESLNGRGVAIFKSELLEDASRMDLDRVFGAAKNGGDICIGFSLGNPEQHFGFAWS